MPAHITGPAGYGRVPRVAGMLTYQPTGGEPLLLAAAHEYLIASAQRLGSRGGGGAALLRSRHRARAGRAEPARRAARIVPHPEQRSRSGHVRDAGAESGRAAADVTSRERRRSRRDAGRGRRRRRARVRAPPPRPARAPNGAASPPKRATPSAAISKPRICSASASRSCIWRWRGRKTIRCSACSRPIRGPGRSRPRKSRVRRG